MKYTLNFIPPGWKIRNFENKISSRKNTIFTHEYESIPNIFRKINLYCPYVDVSLTKKKKEEKREENARFSSHSVSKRHYHRASKCDTLTKTEFA